MGKNIIVYDIETKNSFDDVGGRENFTKLGISVVGAFDYKTDEYIVFEEQELGAMEERLMEKPLLVGFNSKKFDTPILQQYIGFDISKFPQLDIMEEMVKALGHRVSLQSVASATLGEGKSGDGLEAIRLYREGKMDELKSYCLDDVRLTHQIFEYGAKHGELFYTRKFGSGKARAPVEWAIAHPDESLAPDPQQSLF
jgi:DEAD/DEAH box helicase domain-containing protein